MAPRARVAQRVSIARSDWFGVGGGVATSWASVSLQKQCNFISDQRPGVYATRRFLNIADKRFKDGRILLPAGSIPQLQFGHGSPSALLESMSGFEKRSFGIAFSLALAEITNRRIPLVIDTPLGNADSEYRPRTLNALTDFDLDQIIILTHDEEVTPKLLETINGHVCQKFLVDFEEANGMSVVHPDSFFTA